MFGDAEAYERFMGRWSRLVAPPFAEFANLPDNGSVLDVGSGTGSLAFAIAKRQADVRVFGIDPSNEYVEFANSRNAFGSRVNFRVGDAQKLEFPDATFNGAASLLVFNFIPDAKKALSELRRVMKPGSRVSAAVWDYGARMRMLRIFWDAAVSVDVNAEKLDEKRMPLCRLGELSQLWKQGGLENVREEPIDITLRFTSFDDYWNPFLLGQGPAGSFVRSLDRDKREALRGEVKRRLPISSEDEPFDLPARTWAVTGAVPGSA
jgi:SAM-dependent methyltransferase